MDKRDGEIKGMKRKGIRGKRNKMKYLWMREERNERKERNKKSIYSKDAQTSFSEACGV